MDYVNAFWVGGLICALDRNGCAPEPSEPTEQTAEPSGQTAEPSETSAPTESEAG